jgi:hypothetical protein
MKKQANTAWIKIVGWAFVLMCPLVGGNLGAVMALDALGLISHDTGKTLLVATSLAWLALWATWFDGSKFQDLI